MNTENKTLIDKFNEVKDLIPYARLEAQNDGQTLYGDLLEWCRDYFNEPKNSPLAYMLIGYWQTQKEFTQKIHKTKHNDAPKLNNEYSYESFMFNLTLDKFPIAYKAKIDELVSCGMTKQDATNALRQPIELEIYYHKDNGLFAVETDAVENGEIYSPYTAERCQPCEE